MKMLHDHWTTGRDKYMHFLQFLIELFLTHVTRHGAACGVDRDLADTPLLALQDQKEKKIIRN
jgi:hypothetical protein